MHIFGTHDEQTVAQLRDVASRAVKAALMADGHVGYVMPIGGVAAYRDKVSVVGVGFDIACLAAGTQILTADGHWLPIEAVEAPAAIVCWDGERVRRVRPNIGAVPRGLKQLCRLTLCNGRSISATRDHRILTGRGWQEVGSLERSDVVACAAFVGLPRSPEACVLAPPLRSTVLAAKLRERALHLIRSDDPRFPPLVRLLGCVSGDGHLPRDGQRVSVYTTSEPDAADIAADFERLGYTPCIYRRERGAGGKAEIQVCVHSMALHALFEGLGSPVGRKRWPAQPMPWLRELPRWVRAQYLSGFCSAEMMTPRLHGNGTVANLQIKQAGDDDNAIAFHADLFQSLDYETSTAPSGPRYGGRQCWLLQLLGGAKEQLRFFEEIGFCYALEKRQCAAAVASVAWHGAQFVLNRERAKSEARRLKAEGGHWKRIVLDVSARYEVSEGFVYHAVYDDRGASRRLPGSGARPRTTGEICWVPVAGIDDCGTGPVYDVLTADPAECFFANGIVVHNCGNAAIRTDMTIDQLGASPEEVRRSLSTFADEIAATVSFGVGRTNLANDAPVNHELFADDAWDAVPASERHALRDKARHQLGTVGGGNHYVDVFADEAGALWVGVHFGSRGFGHAVASAFLALGQNRGWGERAPAREVLLDVRQPIGHDYWALMQLAGRYAYAGREWVARKVVSILAARELELVHNHHNFAWRETHGGEELIVVRKGATPAFPGQLGFVGGSMGDDAVIIRGVAAGDAERPDVARLQREALYSTVHGAGRVMSRSQAAGKRRRRTGRVVSPGRVTPEMMHEWVARKGVLLRGGGCDESPHVYRRLSEVLAAQRKTIEVMHTLRPLVVVMAKADEFDPYKD